MFTCETCEKVFQQKRPYEAHKTRKRPCKKVVEGPKDEKEEEAVTSVAPTITKPFLKWVGGKTQILGDVLSLFPTRLTNYHEPFVGGGSVLLGLLSHIQQGHIQLSGKVYASDLNRNLIGLYTNIQQHPDAVMEEVKRLQDEFAQCGEGEVNRKATTLEEALTAPESYYFWIRSIFNALSVEERGTPRGSAMMIFLNKTCFRGVYREGPRGFNVPYGNYKNPTILDEEHIRTVSALLQGVVFAAQPFTDSLAQVKPGDFVYLDPPYAPENATSFVSYTADGFDLDAHQALFQRCHEMAASHVHFLMSNADVTLVKDAFSDPAYHTKIISCRRAIHSKNPTSTTNEVLITNYPPN